MSVSGSNLLRSTLLWADSSELRFIRFLRACEQGAIKLLFVAVVVVNAYQRTAEGQNFTEGNEERVVDFTHGRGNEPRREQCAPKSAHGGSDYEL